MKRSSFFLLAILWLLRVNSSIAAVAVLDDEGRQVQLDTPATRIISLAPSLTELLFAAGAGDHIVGVVEWSDFPAAAQSLPVIGRFDMLDMERILQLDPDLIVAWQTGNPQASVSRLQEFGYAVYMAEPKSLDSIPSHIERLAILAGTTLVGNNSANEFRSELASLRQQYQARQAVATFYQVWDRPLITAGGNELINDIIELCGGRNIFADIRLMAPKIEEEAVLMRNPEVIIASGMDVERPEWLDYWTRWPQLAAVQQDNLFFVPPELLQRHTPRALLGTRQMCEHIQLARERLYLEK